MSDQLDVGVACKRRQSVNSITGIEAKLDARTSEIVLTKPAALKASKEVIKHRLGQRGA